MLNNSTHVESYYDELTEEEKKWDDVLSISGAFYTPGWILKEQLSEKPEAEVEEVAEKDEDLSATQPTSPNAEPAQDISFIKAVLGLLGLPLLLIGVVVCLIEAVVCLIVMLGWVIFRPILTPIFNWFEDVYNLFIRKRSLSDFFTIAKALLKSKTVYVAYGEYSIDSPLLGLNRYYTLSCRGSLEYYPEYEQQRKEEIRQCIEESRQWGEV